MLCVGGEDSVIADHVLHRFGHRCGQASQELHGFEDDVGLSCIVGLAQLEADLSVGQQGLSLLGKGRSEPVAQQTIQLAAVTLVAVQIGVEGEAL